MADKEMIEEKIGEALGLEKAAQKGIEELESRGLLKPEHMKKLAKMKEEASRQEQTNGRTSPTSYRIRWIGFRKN